MDIETKLSKLKKPVQIKAFESDFSSLRETYPRIEFTEDRIIKIMLKGNIETQQQRYIGSFVAYSPISYNELVNTLVRLKYDESQEFSILRKYLSDRENETYATEFNEYNEYVELCKSKAREFVTERDEYNQKEAE